ncbi:MAG: Holliday junction branch migration protein RuvA [Gemmatimonadales bacterium]
MIASLTGTLAALDGEEALLHTDGGVGYVVHVPLGVAARLPAPGGRVSLHTELVVREDGWLLFGFDQPEERAVFRRLLEAAGFGPKLALAMLSTLGPERTVRSIRDRDLAALSTVSGVGRKKAERLVLELRDRFAEVTLAPRPAGGAEEAARALVSLGFSAQEADDAVRRALADGHVAESAALVRRALQSLAPKGGR